MAEKKPLPASVYDAALDDPVAIACYILNEAGTSGKGEFQIKKFQGMKVEYDLNTGHLDLVSVNQPPHITSFFSGNGFESILAPVRAAMVLLTRLYLIMELGKQDPKINEMLQSSKLVHGNTVDFSKMEEITKKVSKLFEQTTPVSSLFGLFSRPPVNQAPASLAIYNLLVGLPLVQARQDVDNILKNLPSSALAPSMKSNRSG